jgi:hypothetical protein
MVAKRSAGRSASARCSASSTSGEISGREVRTFGAGVVNRRTIRSCEEEPVKGGAPVSIS